jgi:hypothetical protein
VTVGRHRNVRAAFDSVSRNACIAFLGAGRALFRRGVAVLVAAPMALAATVPAERASESAVRAALVYNFAKFTEWPGNVLAAGEMLSLCVLDDSAMAGELEELVANRTVGQRGLTVRRVRLDQSLLSCHLLYATGLDARRTSRLLELAGSAPILTISDDEDFAERGGIANFFVDGGRVRFAINVPAVQRARLQVSSKLLKLAKVVK